MLALQEKEHSSLHKKMTEEPQKTRFPDALLDWAGHRAGGVRKLFYNESSRPSDDVIMTGLLQRLDQWSQKLLDPNETVPNIVLLVGGPGNGKTEAVEFVVRRLDEAFRAERSIVHEFERQFLSEGGDPPPRLASVDVSVLSRGRYSVVQLVQDASAGDSKNRPGHSPARLVVEELKALLEGDARCIHLACVNRGILDDALIIATEEYDQATQSLISEVVRSVETGPEPLSCWPLQGFPNVAVWPMDIESLFAPDQVTDISTSPAAKLLECAAVEARWPTLGECAAGDSCPFCLSREALSNEPGRTSLLRILRWYELASGKRWSFRDLASLFSFLLAGSPLEASNQERYLPCDWAAKQLALRERAGNNRTKLIAPYLIASKLYRHALFGVWTKIDSRSYKKDLKDLGLQDDPTLAGLLYFLNDPRRAAIPTTLKSQLDEICEILDPALADPDAHVAVSANTTIAYRDIDIRFSQSVGEGLRFIRKYQCLTNLEIDLLKALDEADNRLDGGALAHNRPEIAYRIQVLIRDFSCRFVRRAVGCRSAAVRDGETLVAFEKVVAGDEHLLYEARDQVEELLNKGQHFSVILNSTFGEPIPAAERRVTLLTNRQRVRVPEERKVARPQSALRFLMVGQASQRQFVPLTYEIYKSVRELRLGMLQASLPKAVVALLDITRARLGGRIVRDQDALEDGRIEIGLRQDMIIYQRGRFLLERKSD